MINQEDRIDTDAIVRKLFKVHYSASPGDPETFVRMCVIFAENVPAYWDPAAITEFIKRNFPAEAAAYENASANALRN